MIMEFVLDTYALIVYLRREKNHEIVRQIILETLQRKNRAFMSVINLGELYYMQARKSGIIKPSNLLNSFTGQEF